MIVRIVFLCCLSPLVACSQQTDTWKMSRAEKKKYYAEYNQRHTQKEWDSISKKSQPAPSPQTVSENDRRTASVSFSIKNSSPLSKTYFISGNVLTVGGLKRSFYGFPKGTEIYQYDGHRLDKKGKLLHTVSMADEGKTLKL